MPRKRRCRVGARGSSIRWWDARCRFTCARSPLRAWARSLLLGLRRISTRSTADRQPIWCRTRCGSKSRRARYADQQRFVAVSASVAGSDIVHDISVDSVPFFIGRGPVPGPRWSRVPIAARSENLVAAWRSSRSGPLLPGWLIGVGARDLRRRYLSPLAHRWPGLVPGPSNSGGPAQSRSGSPSSGSGSDSGSRSVSRVLMSRSMSAGWATSGWRLPPVERMSSTMIVRLMSRSPARFRVELLGHVSGDRDKHSLLALHEQVARSLGESDDVHPLRERVVIIPRRRWRRHLDRDAACHHRRFSRPLERSRFFYGPSAVHGVEPSRVRIWWCRLGHGWSSEIAGVDPRAAGHSRSVRPGRSRFRVGRAPFREFSPQTQSCHCVAVCPRSRGIARWSRVSGRSRIRDSSGLLELRSGSVGAPLGAQFLCAGDDQ